MSKTHKMIAPADGPGMPIALCGQANPNMSTDWNDVTCRRCLKKRTDNVPEKNVKHEE